MIRVDIRPENFSAALEETMEKVRDLSDELNHIRMAAEYHHLRRTKQIDLKEAPLDHVPLAIPISTLRMFEHHLTLTRAALETADCKNQQLGDAKLYLVSNSEAKNEVAQ